MPFAITLRLDPVSAATIEGMWLALAGAGIDTDRRDLGYGPHITLGIYPEDIETGLLRTAVRQVAADRRTIPIALSGIGVFPGPTSILWAAPVVTTDLLAWHAAIHAALPDLTVHPHYRPGAWVPHVTLSGAVRDAGRALSALLASWRPIDGMLDRAELVRFRPVEVLRSEALRN
jgi:2'-5' RNA ligase